MHSWMIHKISTSGECIQEWFTEKNSGERMWITFMNVIHEPFMNAFMNKVWTCSTEKKRENLKPKHSSLLVDWWKMKLNSSTTTAKMKLTQDSYAWIHEMIIMWFGTINAIPWHIQNVLLSYLMVDIIIHIPVSLWVMFLQLLINLGQIDMIVFLVAGIGNFIHHWWHRM